MADKKISALTAASTPLAGTEVLPIVQSGSTVKVAVSNLTAGRAVDAASIATTGTVTSGTSTGAAGQFILDRASTSSQQDVRWKDAGVNKWAVGQAVSVVGNYLDFYSYSTGAYVLQLNLAGGASIKGTLTLNDNNLIQGTAAKGINFTANTPAAGMTSQLLNWYEEGTWTAGIAFGGASVGVTYSGQQGTYVRVGRQVTCIGVIALTSKGSSTGSAAITGLPFTVAANEPNYGGVAFGYNYQVSFADMLFGRTIAGGTTIALTETTNAGVDSNITDADFTNASSLRFTVTYFV